LFARCFCPLKPIGIMGIRSSPFPFLSFFFLRVPLFFPSQGIDQMRDCRPGFVLLSLSLSQVFDVCDPKFFWLCLCLFWHLAGQNASFSPRAVGCAHKVMAEEPGGDAEKLILLTNVHLFFLSVVVARLAPRSCPRSWSFRLHHRREGEEG